MNHPILPITKMIHLVKPKWALMAHLTVLSARIAVWPTHRMNHQDVGERWARRSQLVEEIAKICRERDIEHRLYPLDISVKTMPSTG